MTRPGWNRAARCFSNIKSSFAARAAQAAGEAKRNARPASLGWGKGRSDIGINRRQHLDNGRIITGNNPAGPVDREVVVFRIA